ncbi:MAG TPA: class I adenylate-forming enzyme family protein [Solirubrobacteraceae bacterium]|nr:class I adenylate-forming enzyme family protein [Solirubrobacteraceae bacterium]
MTPDTLGAVMREAAARWPESTVSFPGESITFRELDRRADDFGRLVLAAGAEPGDKVGVLLEPCIDFIAALVGIARVGATIVPINERFKARELSYVLRHADVTVVLTTDRVAEFLDFPGLLKEALELEPAPLLRSVVVFGGGRQPVGFRPAGALEDAAAAISPERLEAGVTAEDLALIMYTSGTSAMPKGCMITHDAFTQQGRAMAHSRYFLEPGDCFWCPLPLFHNGGLATLMACLSSGASYVHAGRFDPEVALDQLERHRCTHAIPTFETIWLRVLDLPRFRQADLSSLRVTLNAGTAERLRQLQQRLPHAVQLANYGLTEATGHLSVTLPTDPIELRVNTGGHPLPGMEVRVVDPATGEDRSAGQVGEILFRGPMRFRGYWKDPELTAQIIDRDGWCHSGDLGTVDSDGRVTYAGRLKDMLKVGGENVAAAEVEAFLLTHPAVNIVAVVGAPDARYVEVPAAYIELVDGTECTENEIIEFCIGRIATFKVPRYVRFVDEWPMSGTKIQKFVLREQIEGELRSQGITEAPLVRTQRNMPRLSEAT